MVYDMKHDSYLTYDDNRCQQGFLPASTFKIPNTLIAFETGIMKDTNAVFRWDGQKIFRDGWNQDLNFAQAFRTSCVHCYQEIALKVGKTNYDQWLTKLSYGKITVKADSVEWFWLTGNSRINQQEQIGFLKKLYLNQLPVSTRSMALTKAMMRISTGKNWVLSGKLGWASPNNKAGDRPLDYGWFVGWLEQNNNTYIFALNIESSKPVSESFIQGRKAVTEAILKNELGLMQ